jgi:hypothetical protein
VAETLRGSRRAMLDSALILLMMLVLALVATSLLADGNDVG